MARLNLLIWLGLTGMALTAAAGCSVLKPDHSGCDHKLLNVMVQRDELARAATALQLENAILKTILNQVAEGYTQCEKERERLNPSM